jgi:hypothetical protein
LGELKIKELKNLKSNTGNNKFYENKNKSFSLLTCKKDEFKDWFDPL